MANQPAQWVVGGAIRDVLLGLPPKDIDYCWTGATPADMEAMGFSRVGASFPVFLDKAGNEHALARQEKKVGEGYNGFECEFNPSVTIVQDLERRDLTMNSMAVPIEYWGDFAKTGAHYLVVDPFGGIDDLEVGQLRCTSVAFAEDPIRILRTARFSARYGFDVAPHTIELMRKVVPELSTVPQERVWAEFEKGLMEEFPAKMFEVLQACGALDDAGPLCMYSGANLTALERVQPIHDICVRFALISQNFDLDDYTDCRIPADCARVSLAVRSNGDNLLRYEQLSTSERLKTLELLRALNDTWLLDRCVHVLRCYIGWDCYMGNVLTEVEFSIISDIIVAKGVDAVAIAASCVSGKEIKQKIFNARVRAMEEKRD